MNKTRRDGLPFQRDDNARQRAWKAAPPPPGLKPYCIYQADGVVDLHPSQWRRL